MKQLWLAASITSLLSCFKVGKKDAIKAFMPGTYVLHYKNEYSGGNDPLTILGVSKQGNNYLIERKTSFNDDDLVKYCPRKDVRSNGGVFTMKKAKCVMKTKRARLSTSCLKKKYCEQEIRNTEN